MDDHYSHLEAADPPIQEGANRQNVDNEIMFKETLMLQPWGKGRHMINLPLLSSIDFNLYFRNVLHYFSYLFCKVKLVEFGPFK